MEQQHSASPGYTGYRILTSFDLPEKGEESLSSFSPTDDDNSTAITDEDHSSSNNHDKNDNGVGRNSGNEGEEEDKEVEIKGVLKRRHVWLMVLLGMMVIVLIVIGVIGGKCKGVFKSWCDNLDKSSRLDVQKLRKGSFGILEMSVMTGLIIWCVIGGVFGLFIASFFVVSVIRRNIGTRKMMHIAKVVRKGCLRFLGRVYSCGMVFALSVFLGAGFGLGWKTAACYIVGVLVSGFAQWIGVEVAAMGGVRTSSAACFAPAAALNVAFRGAVVVSLVNVSLGLIAVAGMYMAIKDLESMIGLIAGATTVSILLRIPTAVFAKSADIASDLLSLVQGEISRDDPRNPALVADLVGDNLSAVGGLGADLFESYIGCIIATALLARGLPFYENDPYALCVANHLHIDVACRASSSEPQFFARTLCLRNDFYKEYPETTSWASNSLFAILPLLLALSGILISVLVTFYVYEPTIEKNSPEDTITRKLLNSLRINVLISTGLLIAVGAILCWVLFGPRSDFGRTKGFGRSDAPVPRFTLKGKNGCPDPMTLLRAVETDGLGPDQVLNGTFVPAIYNPVDLSGRNSYHPAQTPARLFSCIVIGLALGTFFGLSTEYFTSASYSPTQSVALYARYGASLGLIQGFGTGALSTALSLVLVVVSIIGSAKLYGGYGVALSSVGALASLGLTMAFEVIAAISDNGEGIAEIAELSSKVRTTTMALDSLGATTTAIGKGFTSGAGILAAYALYLLCNQKVVSFVQRGGVAGPAVFIGSINSPPTRHVTEFVSFPPKSPDQYTVASILFGILVPRLFGALMTLSISCAGQKMVARIRQHYALKKNSGYASVEDNNDGPSQWAQYIELASHEGLLGSVFPFIITVASPLVIGFLLGSISLHSYLMAVIGTGYVQGLFYINTGSSFGNAKKIVKAKRKPSKSWVQAILTGDLLGDALKDGVGVNMSMLIKASVLNTILTISLFTAGRERIWVGIIILGIFLLICGPFVVWKQLFNGIHSTCLGDGVASPSTWKDGCSTPRWAPGEDQSESFPSFRRESDPDSNRLHQSPFYEPRPLGAFNLSAEFSERRRHTMPPLEIASSNLNDRNERA